MVPVPEHGDTGWTRCRAEDSHKGPSLQNGEGGVTAIQGPGNASL